MNEVELILAKLKIVSEEQERGLYLCDKEHSKLLLDYINGLLKQLEDIRTYIKQSDLNKMLWGKELMKILDREE